MPAHLAHKSSTSLDDPTSDLPKTDEPFHDPSAVHKWASFESVKLPRNPLQTSVDLNKKNRLWHYLGRSSTEARPQYTHDPLVKHHNADSNFLGTVAPVITPTSHPAISRPAPIITNFTGSGGAAMLKPGVQTQPLAPGEPPVKRRRGRPPGSKNKVHPVAQPWIQTHAIGPPAMRDQQSFATALAKKVLHPSPSSLGPAIPPQNPYSQPSSSLPRQAATYSAAPIAPHQAFPAPEIPQFRQPSVSTPSHPTTTQPEADIYDAEYLEFLAQYPYLLQCAKSRPAVYQSPYGPPGVITEAFLPFPQAPKANHTRTSSLTQSYLSNCTQSQRASVQGHVRTVSTEKATAIAKEAERRRALSQSNSYFDAMTGPARKFESLSPVTPYRVPATHEPYPAPHAATAPYPSPTFHSPHLAQTARYVPGPLYPGPRDFSPQMALETAAAYHRHENTHSISPALHPTDMLAKCAPPSIAPDALSIHTPPPSNHSATMSNDGTSGSPLRAGRDGVGREMLPMMHVYRDD